MPVFNLAYLATSLAYQMNMIVASHLIYRTATTKGILAKYSSLFEKKDSVIDSGAAYMIAIVLDGKMQGIHLEMGIHLKSLMQYGKAFRSLTQLPD